MTAYESSVAAVCGDLPWPLVVSTVRVAALCRLTGTGVVNLDLLELREWESVLPEDRDKVSGIPQEVRRSVFGLVGGLEGFCRRKRLSKGTGKS